MCTAKLISKFNVWDSHFKYSNKLSYFSLISLMILKNTPFLGALGWLSQ